MSWKIRSPVLLMMFCVFFFSCKEGYFDTNCSRECKPGTFCHTDGSCTFCTASSTADNCTTSNSYIAFIPTLKLTGKTNDRTTAVWTQTLKFAIKLTFQKTSV